MMKIDMCFYLLRIYEIWQKNIRSDTKNFKNSGRDKKIVGFVWDDIRGRRDVWHYSPAEIIILKKVFFNKLSKLNYWTLIVFNSIHNIAQTIHIGSSSGKIRKTKFCENRNWIIYGRPVVNGSLKAAGRMCNRAPQQSYLNAISWHLASNSARPCIDRRRLENTKNPRI